MQLVLIRGLPGSGKTTMAQVLEQVGYRHYEADQYFMRDGKYCFAASDLPKAHAWCLSQVSACIERGERVVVSNTFTQYWEIAPYIKVAREFRYEVRVIEAKGKWESCHGVPPDAIQRMRERWQEIPARYFESN